MATYKKLPKDPANPDGPARAWRVQLTVGKDHDTGKRKILTKTFPTKKEAELWASKGKVDENEGVVIQPSRDPVATYLKRWLATKKRTVRARTHADYAQMLNRYIIRPPDGYPNLGALRMNQIRQEAIEELYTFMMDDQKLSVRTVRLLDSILRQAFRDAVDARALRFNPAPSRKKLPKEDPDEVAAMTDEEARRFLEAAASDPLRALWTTLLVTGARPSEALALQWRDLEGNRLRIRRTLTRRGVEGWKTLPPKTKAGTRSVTLPAFCVEALAQHRRTQAEERLKAGPEYAKHPGGGFIFAGPKGEPLEQTALYRGPFQRVLRAAELGTWEGEGDVLRFVPGFTMYSLRHSAASIALRTGVNPKVTAAVLGHSKIGITLDTYSHLIEGQQDEVADRMQSVLGEPEPVPDLPKLLQTLADLVSRGGMEPAALDSLERLLAGFVKAHSFQMAAEGRKGTG